MRFADASLAAACFVQLFATAWGLPPLDQLVCYATFVTLVVPDLLLGNSIESVESIADHIAAI
jgi:hypothetical protein